MKLVAEVQNCCSCDARFSPEHLQQWADCVADIEDVFSSSFNPSGDSNLGAAPKTFENERQVFVRLVEPEEMENLNGKWRSKHYATNVLAFPAGDMPGVDNYPIGDIVICVEIVQTEAIEQGKPFMDRMAHIFIHGLLHLVGFDHELPEQAIEMERIEEEALSRLGYAKPYE